MEPDVVKADLLKWLDEMKEQFKGGVLSEVSVKTTVDLFSGERRASLFVRYHDGGKPCGQ